MSKKKKSIDVQDVCVRTLKTFVQAFLASLAVSVAGVTNVDTAKSAAIAAVAAGIAAVWNTVKELRA